MKHIDIIQDGTVIDHITPGMGRKILDILGESGQPTMFGMNLTSTKYTKKDIIKYSGRTLSEEELNLISALSPEATINTVVGGVVVKKEKRERPETIEQIFKCSNPKCITNTEYSKSRFYTTPALRCFYCERVAI